MGALSSGRAAGPGPLAVLLVAGLTLGVGVHARLHPPVAPEPPPPQVNERLARQLVPDAMPSGPPGSSRPDGLKPLVPTALGAAELPLPGLAELDPVALDRALLLLNGVWSPCAPCRAEGYSLARCLAEAPPGCDTAQPMGERVVRLVSQPWDVSVIRPLVEHADERLRVPPDLGLPWLGVSTAPVQVVLAVQLDSPFCAEALLTWSALHAHYDGRIAVRLLLLPPQGRDGERWSREVVAAEALGDLDALLKLLPASSGMLRADVYRRAGLDPAWMADQVEQAQPGVDLLLRQAQALGARSTPTAYVNGVRVRGLQSDTVLLELIDGELRAEGG